MSTTKELATLAGGCFWCLEAVYEQLRGVEKVQSGYSGGHLKNPSYEDVCDETTGHAEVVQLTFDPKVISYKEIAEVFFTIHDPTTLNRQGPDVGTRYRSAIFYHSDEQKKAAEKVIADFTKQNVWGKPIVTQVDTFKEFYPAEDYHNQYYQNNRMQPYCMFIIQPKVAKFRKAFIDKLKK